MHRVMTAIAKILDRPLYDSEKELIAKWSNDRRAESIDVPGQIQICELAYQRDKRVATVKGLFALATKSVKNRIKAIAVERQRREDGERHLAMIRAAEQRRREMEPADVQTTVTAAELAAQGRFAEAKALLPPLATNEADPPILVFAGNEDIARMARSFRPKPKRRTPKGI